MAGIHKDGYLTGKLLLAMPAMGDTRFHNAVIYICSHDENGAMGLVINHAVPGMVFKDILTELPFEQELESEIDISPSISSMPIMLGGPVDAGRGFLLHSNDFSEEHTISVDDDFGVTATLDAVLAVVKGEGPRDKLFILGYAGWSAGQLDNELQNNSWLVAEAKPNLIFTVPHGEKWTRAITGLGFDPAMLSSDSGHA